ncbi:MAG TPA: GNAT family N-acetyltransferase [Planctomycetota bacterium]|nr:GNAT family N-acetyltransferase [Planctomycetota bacterium]
MTLDISPVRGSRDLETFIRLPESLYRDDPTFVPMLRSSERRMLDARRNPFYLHAEAEHYIARREGRPVGRVSAIRNLRHEEIHPDDKVGFFGYFDVGDDPETARALLGAAESWVRARGLAKIRGPVNPSTNDPCGTLIAGFKWPPFILMTGNPPYTPNLIEGAGYAKSKDLLAYFILRTEAIHEKIRRIAAEVRSRGRVTIRPFDLSQFERELNLVMEIYNDAWSRNWGFVPMTPEEVRFSADDLRAIVLPELSFFAFLDGKAVGFAFALPDINHSLKRAKGRLWPFGWIWFLKPFLRKIPTFRILALGVRKEQQQLGIGTLFYERYMDVAKERGYTGAELSWILEDNELMNRPLRTMGARTYKTYRLYEKTL